MIISQNGNYSYRNAIGSYYDEARLLSSYGHGNSNSLSRHTNCKNPVIKIKGFAKLFGHLALKMILVLFCVGLIVQAVVFEKLIQDGILRLIRVQPAMLKE